jgi:hypothetical protein
VGGFLGYRIIAPWVERMATEDPPDGQIASPEGSVSFKRFKRIGAACGVEAAAPWFEGRNEALVEADQKDEQGFHNAV